MEQQLREQLLRDGVALDDIELLLQSMGATQENHWESQPELKPSATIAIPGNGQSSQTYIINTHLPCQSIESILYQYLEDNELPIEVTSVVSNSFGVVSIRLSGPDFVLKEHEEPFKQYVTVNEVGKEDQMNLISTCKVDIPQDTYERIRDQMVIFTEKLSQEFGVNVTSMEDGGKPYLQAQSHSHELLDVFLSQSTSLLSFENIERLGKYFPCTVSHVNITECVELLLGDKKRVLNYLAREYSVATRIFQNKKNKTILEASNNGNQDAVTLFITHINNIVKNPQAFQRDLHERKEKQLIHLFVDISNIEIGCKNLYGRDFRVDIERMTDVVVNMRGCAKRLGVGSYNLQNNAAEEAVKNRWKKWGYEVRLLQRLSTGEEQGVDDIIHAAIQQDILKTFPTRRTLVVLTGDGNSNNNRTNFPEIIEQALRNGWKIEIWSWKDAVSTIYRRFQDTYSSQFSLMFLDNYKETIIFQQIQKKSNNNYNSGSSNKHSY